MMTRYSVPYFGLLAFSQNKVDIDVIDVVDIIDIIILILFINHGKAEKSKSICQGTMTQRKLAR